MHVGHISAILSEITNYTLEGMVGTKETKESQVATKVLVHVRKPCPRQKKDTSKVTHVQRREVAPRKWSRYQQATLFLNGILESLPEASGITITIKNPSKYDKALALHHGDGKEVVADCLRFAVQSMQLTAKKSKKLEDLVDAIEKKLQETSGFKEVFEGAEKQKTSAVAKTSSLWQACAAAVHSVSKYTQRLDAAAEDSLKNSKAVALAFTALSWIPGYGPHLGEHVRKMKDVQPSELERLASHAVGVGLLAAYVVYDSKEALTVEGLALAALPFAVGNITAYAVPHLNQQTGNATTNIGKFLAKMYTTPALANKYFAYVSSAVAAGFAMFKRL